MKNTRQDWIDRMLRIVSPVFDALEKGELRKRLPMTFHPERAYSAMLEAFGRSMLGIAPWLEADEEGLSEQERELQKAWREKVIRCIDTATDPASPDFMNFTEGWQPLVDAAFLAHALVRARKHIADQLPERVRKNLVNALVSSRVTTPGKTNWLFFSAMVEAGLRVLGADCDLLRVIYPMRVFRDWYAGDGIYGDGASFHWDYYNSFVIQPMYVDLADLLADSQREIAEMHDSVIARASRYASVLERMIGPEGTYPVIGRSICYRFGAFQMLAQAALQHRLQEHLSPASVRCALTAVIHRVMEAPDMFDAEGWLLPGVYGEQPELAEVYICVGSLYLCSAVFLPLGLGPQDPFWADPDEDWTGKKVWSGGHIPIDHAED